MTRRRAIVAWSVLLLLAAAFAGAEAEARVQARHLMTNPVATRKVPHETPAALHLDYSDVTVTTSDGLRLVGWWIPVDHRAPAILVVHGYKDSREQMLGVSALFHRLGYGVLALALRAHDRSDGELITFGAREVQDVDAWYRLVAARPDVDAAHVGIFGVSMGGTIAIAAAAENPHLDAVVADSAFSSLDDTVATSIKYFTGLPPFPFAPMIVFWADREAGLQPSDVDAKRWIPRISPRPILLMQGGADVVIPRDSGERLYAAAGEPKQLWYAPNVAHAKFFATMPAEFERRVGGFFARYLR